MPRPTSKDSLLTTMQAERQKLTALLDTLSPEQMTQPHVCGEWAVKDMLAHLFAWEQMVLSWYRAGARGEAVKTPAPDLKWSEIPVLNQRIYEQYRAVPLEEIRATFEASYAEMLAAIQEIPEEALITPKFYAWTKTTLLISYFVSSTSSHYHWAYDAIRKWKKAQGK